MGHSKHIRGDSMFDRELKCEEKNSIDFDESIFLIEHLKKTFGCSEFYACKRLMNRFNIISKSGVNIKTPNSFSSLLSSYYGRKKKQKMTKNITKNFMKNKDRRNCFYKIISDSFIINFSRDYMKLGIESISKNSAEDAIKKIEELLNE